VRGETVRRLGNALREQKHELGQLVTLETGKIIAEGEGEVQEMIDICDFAVGQSRMLYGLTIQSERPSHRLMEQWHPLGVIAVITAFNFPVAVWSWNAALAAVCGDATVWKPSEKTPLTAIAVTKICERVCRETGADPAIFTLLMGDRKTVGQKLADDARIPLVSATGSVNMGLHVAKTVHGRLGRSIMELGGNNALIVAPSADLDMATQSIFFGAVGTAGQRCTSTRRVIVHESIASKVRRKLLSAYKSLAIGNPLDRKTVMGPLIDKSAVDLVQHSIQRLKDEGGEVLYGGERLTVPGDCYMKPCLATAKPDFEIVKHETFGPLLYLLTYRDFDQAIANGYDAPEVFFLRGSCLNDLGFYFDALEDYNKAIQKQPSQGIANNYFMRSIIKDSLFDFEGSVADLKEAIRLSKLDNDDNRFWNDYAKSTGFESQTAFYEWSLPSEEMILFRKRTYADEKIADELKKIKRRRKKKKKKKTPDNMKSYANGTRKESSDLARRVSEMEATATGHT